MSLGSGSKKKLSEALSPGANDFVEKPVLEVELLARVSDLARLPEAHARAAELAGLITTQAEQRRHFLHAWVHDFRQPLSTIYLACQSLMLPKGAPGTVPGALGMQKLAVERMKRMLDELLDFTSGEQTPTR